MRCALCQTFFLLPRKFGKLEFKLQSNRLDIDNGGASHCLWLKRALVKIQVGLAILKSSILYIFWGARKPRNGFEQSLFKCGCAQNVLFDFSPVVKVHQVVSCAAAIFKKQVVLGLSVCRALSSFSHLPLTQRL